jgi:hypothetical protein
MSYNLMLQCGCLVYVACDPSSAVAHTRIIERRAAACRNRRHAVGVRLSLVEIVPHIDDRPASPVEADRRVIVANGDDRAARPRPTRQATHDPLR